MWFVYSIVTFSDYSYISVTEWVKSPINCILITSMFASIFYHSSFLIYSFNIYKMILLTYLSLKLTIFASLSVVYEMFNFSFHNIIS